jgi:hypothetical protein
VPSAKCLLLPFHTSPVRKYSDQPIFHLNLTKHTPNYGHEHRNSPIPAHSRTPAHSTPQPQSPRPEATNPTFPRPAPTPIPATHPAVPTLLHGFKRSNWCRHLTRGIPNHFKRCTPGHALRPLPNRPPPPWRRPQRPLLLGLRQSQWRPLHDPHRRHRPGPLQR